MFIHTLYILQNAELGTFLKGALEVSDLDETPAFSNVTLTCDSSNGEEVRKLIYFLLL